MITDLLATMVFGILNAVLSLIPTFTIPTTSTDAAGGNLGAEASFIGDYFPVGDAALILAASLAVAGFLTIVNASQWVYHQFWGSS